MLAYKRANKNSSYRDMVDEYNNEYLEKYPDGGSIPTTQDSTNVYNAQIALNKFYDEEEKLGRITEVGSDPIFFTPTELNHDNLHFYRELIDDRKKFNEVSIPITFDDEYKQYYNLSPDQVKKLEYQGLGYTKSGNEHVAYYRDLITPMQNLRSPMALYDNRIIPDGVKSYTSTNINYPGGNVEVYYYNPSRIKPYYMLTNEEKLKRNKSLHLTPLPQVPVVKQSNNRSLQQNGYKPGTKLDNGTTTVLPTLQVGDNTITQVQQNKQTKDVPPPVGTKPLPQNVKYKTGYGTTNFYWIKEGNKVMQLTTPEEYLRYDYPEVNMKDINPTWTRK